jgi:hypothetical protein
MFEVDNSEGNLMENQFTKAVESIRQTIYDITDGKPFVLVIMPFDASKQKILEQVAVAADKYGRRCVRADEIEVGAIDILTKIQVAITIADLVIADITDHNPNVFYELGYSHHCKGTPPLLIAHATAKPATDLKGLEVIYYEDETEIPKRIHGHLRSLLSSRPTLLTDFLLGEIPLPAYILTGPKFLNGEMSGDNLGIVGLLTAFAAIQGTPQLLSAATEDTRVYSQQANLYLIGSPNVNSFTRKALIDVQGQVRMWDFAKPVLTQGPTGIQVPLALYRNSNGTRIEQCAEWRDGVVVRDWGLILRARNPKSEGRVIMVMAGAHSLGTGAACQIATRTRDVAEISKKLKAGMLENKADVLWILVEGSVPDTSNPDQFEAKVIEVGTYTPFSRHASAGR